MGAIRLWITLLVCFSLVTPPVYATDIDSGFAIPSDVADKGKGTEFTSGAYPGALMMRINLWGAVGKAGIHFIPTGTDLITLLSYAGGPLALAELDNIVIKRRTKNRERVIKIDMENYLTSIAIKSPALEANDIVFIPSTKPIISQNTALILGTVTSLLGLILVSFALSDRLTGTR